MGVLFAVLVGIMASSSISPWFATSVASVAMVGAWVHSKRLTSALTVCAPFILFSFVPSDFVYKFRLSTPLGYISFTVILIYCLFLVAPFIKVDKQILKRCYPVLGMLALFIIVKLISLLANDYSNGGLKEIFKTAALSLIVFYVTITLTRQRDVPWILKCVVIVSTVVSLLGILEFAYGFQPYFDAYRSNDFISFTYNNVAINGYLRRVVSSIGNPLVLSTYLLLSLPVVFYLKQKVKRQTLLNISLMAHMLAILLTLSRTSIVILFVVYFIYLLRSHKVSMVIKGTLLLGISASAFYYGLKYFLVDTLFWERMTFKLSSNSLTHRSDSYGVMMTMLHKNPFFGLGSDGVTSYLINSSWLAIPTLDNVYLQIIAETGLIGIALYVLLLIAIHLKVRKLEPENRFSANILLLVMTCSGFAYHIMYFEAVWGVFWFLLALLLSRAIPKAS